jgi:hypothetical protein
MTKGAVGTIEDEALATITTFKPETQFLRVQWA